jgi:hypothetical protein
MNYKLSVTLDNSAPEEAIRIADEMGANSEWINAARAELEVNNN